MFTWYTYAQVSRVYACTYPCTSPQERTSVTQSRARRRLARLFDGAGNPRRKSGRGERAHGTTRHDTIITTLGAIRLSRTVEPWPSERLVQVSRHFAVRRPYRLQRLRLAPDSRLIVDEWRLADVDATSPPALAVPWHVAAVTFLAWRRELRRFPAFSRGAELYGVRANACKRDGQSYERRAAATLLPPRPRDKKTSTIFGVDGRGCAYIRTAQLRKIASAGGMERRKEGKQDERAGSRAAGRSAPSPDARSSTWRGRVVVAYATAPPSPGARGPREYVRKDVRASPRPRWSAGEGGTPPLTHAAHGMKTRLDEGVSDVPAGLLTLDVSSTLLSLLVSVLASDISSRANHSKTLGNPRFHGENSRCARSHCLYDEERWRLAWVTWHLVKPQSGSSTRRPAPPRSTTRVATHTRPRDSRWWYSTLHLVDVSFFLLVL